ncbi:MAG TPA: hypothetical protein PK079_23185 [Leptospiraceae bacterium]|nr:hypothetical protein [Leptospiraceae bacterium]HMW06346.1 hypothetical protein [Leptospiraceae bacterium]HMX30975.1 hypothetical protein [Leptospiraceae bacterium]HMY32206.1 hypothetical protein [Leptospiraceae bacterium]HMZ63793.1 hypothetical protein [Leptospiraceae bacterium]
MDESVLKKIVILNLKIYGLITLCELILVAGFIGQGDQKYGGVFFMILSMFSIFLQVLTNIILSIYNYKKEDKEKAKAYLLSFIVILLVGFPSCFGFGTVMSIR